MQRKPSVIFYNKLTYTIMTIYISIPISGHDVKKVREKADLTKAMLSRAGHKVITPFEVPAGKNPVYKDYICCDLRALLDCDAIYLCDGWQFSQGCQLEAEAARIYKLQVMYERQPSDGGAYFFNR